MFVTIIISITLLFTGGVSFMAESSQPGEILYPVKVYFNESLESAVTLGAENEAELQLELIEQRMQEKNELKAQGKLTVQLENQIENQIEIHTQRFQKEKIQIEANGNTQVSSSLETQFESLVGVTSAQSSIDVDTQTSTRSQDDETSTNNQTQINGSTETNIDTASVEAQIKNTTNTVTGASVEVISDIKSNIDTSVQAENEIQSDIIDVTSETKLNGNITTQ